MAYVYSYTDATGVRSVPAETNVLQHVYRAAMNIPVLAHSCTPIHVDSPHVYGPSCTRCPGVASP